MWRSAGTTASPGALLIAVLLAAGLGALHALTPGHGKALAAAYLVGSRGTIRNAVALGGIVTFTHTFSVILIGLVALFASQYIVPGVLAPALSLTSGALIVGLGLWLLWTRWPGRARTHDHDHEHDHDHDHDHDHEIIHEHGGSRHTHDIPQQVSPKGLLLMGISGGLVPCPEALAVMIFAVGVNRIVLGLSLIAAFSLGLAAVLVGLAIAVVVARPTLDRLTSGRRWPAAALPLVSAVVVTILGMGILASGWSALTLG